VEGREDSPSPPFPLLNEYNNARHDFLEAADILAIIEDLPDHINEMALFAYLTGWAEG